MVLSNLISNLMALSKFDGAEAREWVRPSLLESEHDYVRELDRDYSRVSVSSNLLKSEHELDFVRE